MESVNEEKALEKIPAERVPEVVAAIQEKTSMSAYRLVIEGDRIPGLTETKFGGLPYWPINLDYPTTPKGQKLMLLAQLRLEDFGGDPRLPDHGLLQFYIDAADDCSGMDFDDSTNQSGFRVIWHESVDETVTPGTVEALGMPTSRVGFDEDYPGNPLNGEFAVRVEPTTSWMTETEDGRFDAVYMDVCHELFGADFLGGRRSPWDLLDDTGEAVLFDGLKGSVPEHRVLGYPVFTQYDPRLGDLMDEFATLLLQIDSSWDSDAKKDRIMWGDVGIGGFFINAENLKRGDFSRVLFNWDCY